MDAGQLCKCDEWEYDDKAMDNNNSNEDGNCDNDPCGSMLIRTKEEEVAKGTRCTREQV